MYIVLKIFENRYNIREEYYIKGDCMKKIVLLFALVVTCGTVMAQTSYYNYNQRSNRNTSTRQNASSVQKTNFASSEWLNQRYSVYLGIGGGVHVNGEDSVPMESGIFWGNLGAQYLINEYISLGLEGTLGRTSGKGDGLAVTEQIPLWAKAEQDDDYLFDWGVGLAGRFYLKPSGNIRWYVPVGGGYMYMERRTKYDIKANPDYPYPFPPSWAEDSVTEKKKAGDGAYVYAGLGVEYVLPSGFAAGLETRFQSFKMAGTWLQTVNLAASLGLHF